MKFSDEWLSNFKRRWSIRHFEARGESGNADKSALKETIPELLRQLSELEQREVFNAYECGLLYKLACDAIVTSCRPAGREKMKERFTAMVCANADGSEKIPLIFNGNGLRPREFKKKFGKDFGLDYHNNRKAWINGFLFKDWLVRFNCNFKTQN